MYSPENPRIVNKPNAQVECLGIAILLLLAAGFFYPMLFDGKVIFYRDYSLITYPIRYFLGQSFNQGVIPYWMPHANGGMPFMSSFHPGVFYPPSLLFILEDTTYAINLFYVLHFLILGVFTYLLTRSWGFSFVAALCSAVTGMLSGFIMASVLLSNLFISAVWLPAVFWLFHEFWTIPGVIWSWEDDRPSRIGRGPGFGVIRTSVGSYSESHQTLFPGWWSGL
jgi:hypothetical protein